MQRLFKSTKCNIDSERFVWRQVGEFYETIGLDALVVMQCCSLNPMSKRYYPHAGTPLANIHQILRDLVPEAGFSVVRTIFPLPNSKMK